VESDEHLRLDHIRGVLIRLEETIIFWLIERAQYARNDAIYVPGGMGGALGELSLLDYLLRECECSHAKVRRYTSPDEHPFFGDLPGPVLPPLAYPSNPLHPNTVNINAAIKEAYERDILPAICLPGDDLQYGSSAVNDVNLLQALSKRIHYGKFVAESKYRQAAARFDGWIRGGDREALLDAITAPEVEAQLFERVHRKTVTYVRELAHTGEHTIAPETVRGIYERWIVPLSKRVEVGYLLQRRPDRAPEHDGT
jgi:chorismate mutase